MVPKHGLAIDLRCGFPPCFQNQTRFPEKFIALENGIVIPALTIQPKRLIAAFKPSGLIASPAFQVIFDGLKDCEAGIGPAIFPWEIVVPALPATLRLSIPGQGHVGNTNQPVFLSQCSIPERIKLFHMPQPETCLLLDPVPQTALKRRVLGF